MIRIDQSLRLACCALLLGGLTGCVDMRVGDLTMVSTKNVDLSDTQLDAKQGKRVTGENCKWSVLGIPLGQPDLKDAVDNALENGQSNMLVDEVTRVKASSFIVAGKACYVVEGTAVNIAPKQ